MAAFGRGLKVQERAEGMRDQLIRLDTDGIMRALGLEAVAEAAEGLRITIPARIRRTGLAVRFVLETGQHAAAGPVDQKLVVAIARAKAW